MSDGIQDPWRTAPPPPTVPEDDQDHILGTSSSTDPMDWDLQPEQTFVLRAPGQDYAIKVTPANSITTAAKHLLTTIAQVPQILVALQNQGFTLGDVACPPDRGFHLSSAGKMLCHPSSPNLEHGFSHLVQALVLAGRKDRTLQTLLTKHGIVPLLP